ncbi:sugar transferase [Williamwhitmania taraxaci]|uniref:Exopolysaccharide biosynthesis polyprenyl glycosylphosphotransferase n=1 Tax=Williamwhitmania taraxaci TaxID=1640674 RepID=A0A1G6JIW7_9BACT|nr:sugar transferase [Williamwhitmania taraxaci]SDC18663.1 exopolysaccharide biosynthesis polyprenyl glycosylphosphotransferase [Williamwhitmania taraxaci]
MKRTLLLFNYLLFDCLSAIGAWCTFYFVRVSHLRGEHLSFIEICNSNFLYSLAFVTIFWILLYILTGFYTDVFRRSRINDFFQTVGQVILGSIILFFILILGDFVGSAREFYLTFGMLLGIQFAFTYTPRLIINSFVIYQIRNKRLGFKTIIVGDGSEAEALYHEIEGFEIPQGQLFIGYVAITAKESKLSDFLPCLGTLNELSDVIDRSGVDEVIIALSHKETQRIQRAINDLYGKRVEVKVIPSLYDFLTGKVKMSSIMGTPLILVNHRLMPAWQEMFKFILDFVVSFLAIFALLPFGLIVSTIIKLTSRGPVFFTQERIGRYGKPFVLIKFRSMCLDSEKHGPALSSKSDARVTPFGRFMRKTRIDELPNFINVLKGDMSLVGPRPERQFYIDQIVKIAPHYLHLQKVKPGITSWGQVKYGYAESVDQMVERLKYDLLYLENMSLLVDLRIIIYTLITVFRGRGI